ncbi:2Fe-2S iron-sulfur cluster-binding protein [Pseudahrensia aquimaris]|uniref:2Fe-2S iron-sulfur cluster-binding protein n=1 Tax=Pseudahrensia aquimaris TaxID=744461 RepID=A0ABW3FHX4_9HYPH
MHSTLNFNGKIVPAERGETLVDAALSAGILVPHDCATGQCETCRVRVVHGAVEANNTNYGDTVLACQARVSGDATITFDEALPVERRHGQIETIHALSDDVLEITTRLNEPLLHRPGQYAKIAFNGFPPREYSFSAPVGDTDQPDQAIFHIKRLANGRVSSQFGKAIEVGHALRIEGPYGSAYLREAEDGPLVLASTGTGFAPIWSLARSVVKSGSARQVSLITGVHNPSSIYMMPALRWLAENSRANIVLTARSASDERTFSGTPDQHLPSLNNETSIHVAGNPRVVTSTQQLAAQAGARCYADPFTASQGKSGLIDRLRGWSGLSGRL